MDKIEEIIKYFPIEIYNNIMQIVSRNIYNSEQLQEIRIRANQPIILKYRNEDIIIKYIVKSEEILQILERFCENSIYAYKNQICQGFLTIRGGHRVGITGSIVSEDNKIINIKYISSLNIRIAKEIINCSRNILSQILDFPNNTIFNTIIISPPGKGKTTMLRDIIRQISNGIPEKNFKGLTVGLIDERGEIAATYKGIPQNNVGIRTDVMGNVDKKIGIEMLIRSMAPDVIACDEIGGVSDIQAIKKAMVSGVKGIFTMHGKNMEDLRKNDVIYNLVDNNQIEKIIFI